MGYVAVADVLDEDDAQGPAVPVGAGQLVLQHRADEAIVEQAGGPIHDVERLCLRLAEPDTTVAAEVGPSRQDRATGATALGVDLTPPEEVSKPHGASRVAAAFPHPRAYPAITPGRRS